MTLLAKDLNGASLKGSDIGNTRKVTTNPSNTMRKYQQLALAVVSVISLVAFLFYKHEYDRLRYTLEYLEMFGSPPDQEGFASAQSCGSNTYRRLRTTPPTWVKVSNDLVIYSTFWEEGNGVLNPMMRTLGFVKKGSEKRFELKALAWYEGSSSIIKSDCTLEKIKERNHATLSTSAVNGIMLVYLICQLEKSNLKPPLSVQFQIGRSPPSSFSQIQESESWKSVANATAACVFATSTSDTTQNLVEFIAFHSVIGVEKFTFYGPVLTPLARKLLDKYSDEIGIFYEELSFNVPNDISLNDEQTRSIIEKDCVFRHRDIYENVIVLRTNQFLLPKTKSSLQGIVNAVASSDNRPSPTVSEFHFQTQIICVDSSHKKRSELLFDSELRMVALKKEEGVALIRPHLNVGIFRSRSFLLANEQHIPSSVALVLTIENCSGQEAHDEGDHLPSTSKFAELIRKSLLHRKWKVNA